MKASFIVVLTCCLLLLPGSRAVFAQSLPAATAVIAHAKVYVNVPQAAMPNQGGADTGSWRSQLERSGILSQGGPYRVGLPIAQFGEGGPKLMFTYIPRMKDGLGSRVMMFMLRTSID